MNKRDYNTKNKSQQAERLDYLDVSKAIGIYLVILGHLVLLNWRTFRFIFAFHMPLFFIIAGFLWGIKKELPSFTNFIRKNIRHYIFPYIIVFLLSFFHIFIIHINDLQTLFTKDIVRDIYEGHLRFSYFGSSWFLLCMFWAQLIVYGLMKLKKYKKYIFYISIILLAALAIYSSDIFSFIPFYKRLPLKIDSALMAALFIIVGYYISLLYSKINLFKEYKYRIPICISISLLSFAIMYFVSFKGNTYVNMCELKYARPERYLAGSVFGSLMVINISYLLEKISILKFIGKNTLIIFLIHEVVFSMIINIFNRVFGLSLTAQSMILDYKCIIISVLTLIICSLIALLYRITENSILKKKNKP